LIFVSWPSGSDIFQFSNHKPLFTPAVLSLVKVGLPASVPSDNRLPFPYPVLRNKIQLELLHVLFLPLRTYACDDIRTLAHRGEHARFVPPLTFFACIGISTREAVLLLQLDYIRRSGVFNDSISTIVSILDRYCTPLFC
jgi:hypothetical protein